MSIRVNIATCILLLTISKAEFSGQFPYLAKLYIVSREPIRLPEIQYLCSVWYLY